MPESTKEWKESTRPGTVSRVFEQHKKNQLNHDGKPFVFIVPVVPINPNILKYG